MSVNVTDTLNQLVSAAAVLESEVERLRVENAALKDKHSNRKKLTPGEVARIRLLYGTRDWNQAQLADAFDINAATVSRIVRGIYHK